MRGITAAPSLQALASYAVNAEGQPEVNTDTLYDYQEYPAAGFTSLKFFQTPAGQGSKTFADTNLETAGVLSQPQNFLVTTIEVVFFPGSAPSRVGDAAATAAGLNWNDVNAVAKAGWFEMIIGSKHYVREAPVGVLPPSFRLAGAAALSDASTAGANLRSQIDYAVMAGQLYAPNPLRLVANQNFNCTLNFSTAVALPSGVAGRIGIRLGGYRYRLAQ